MDEGQIAILTNFMDWKPGYSLSGIVRDQVMMLTDYGHQVHLLVNERYKDDPAIPIPEGCTIHKVVPFCHLHDFTSRKELDDLNFKGKGGQGPEYFKDIAVKTEQALSIALKDFKMVLTHDIMFLGWFLPYCMGVVEVGKKNRGIRWLHWIHSVPTAFKDWWSIREWGSTHKLVYPNRSNLVLAAEQFRGAPSDVRVIPHIKDMKTWYDFDPETIQFIKDYPAVQKADIVQIYPASVDRLEAKRVREVILIFSKLKKMGNSVCLVIANQWATTLAHKENVERYKQIAHRNGLIPGEEVIFTSDWKISVDRKNVPRAKYEVGLPKRILRELMSYMNLFIFPTKEETWGLVLPEASLSSGCLCVLNKNLQLHMEMTGFNTIYFNFGSFEQTHTTDNEDAYLKDLAIIILGRLRENEGINTRTFFRKSYNWDALYGKYYAPIMAESIVWAPIL